MCRTFVDLHSLFMCTQQATMKVWKRLSTCHTATNKQRIRAIKRDPFKSVMKSWKAEAELFFLFNIYFFVLFEKKVLTLQNCYQPLNMEGRTVWAIFGTGSVTKAMTSQLCFHSFIQGGGGRGGRAMWQQQQWLNKKLSLHKPSLGFGFNSTDGNLWHYVLLS